MPCTASPPLVVADSLLLRLYSVFESVPPDSRCGGSDGGGVVLFEHYCCSWNNGRSEEHDVALAGAQLLHKPPLFREHGKAIRGHCPRQ